MSGREWLCMGDFNEILTHGEKQGGRTTLEWRLRDFREALVHNDLNDLGFRGHPYTWANNHEEPYNIRERLDRAVSSKGWLDFFPKAQLHHLSTWSLDHVPILLYLDGLGQRGKRYKKRFHFEAMCG